MPDDRELMSVASQGELRLVKQAPELPRLPWSREFAAAVAEAACRPCDQRAEVKDRGRIVRRAFRLVVLSSMAGGGRPRFHPDCQHAGFVARTSPGCDWPWGCRIAPTGLADDADFSGGQA